MSNSAFLCLYKGEVHGRGGSARGQSNQGVRLLIENKMQAASEDRMRVLVACEESQAVCREFRKLGHEAFSCDIEPCSGGHPEWHIQGDVLPL